MNNLLKGVLLVLTLLYVVSPADCLPGPIDDAIVILLNIAANKKLGSSSGE